MNDGGPAFPTVEHEWNEAVQVQVTYWGMSLRDWFAGMALNAGGLYMGSQAPAYIAETAYGIADAMLAEREEASTDINDYTHEACAKAKEALALLGGSDGD